MFITNLYRLTEKVDFGLSSLGLHELRGGVYRGYTKFVLLYNCGRKCNVVVDEEKRSLVAQVVISDNYERNVTENKRRTEI